MIAGEGGETGKRKMNTPGAEIQCYTGKFDRIDE
jgi:hypothetical protein